MGDEHFTFDIAPDHIFADTEKRIVSGIAIPLGQTAEKAGRKWRFLPNSVAFSERHVLLSYHDQTRPVGRLISTNWEAGGCRTTFKIASTPAGDEALQLAHEGILGLSVGINVDEFGAKKVGDEFHVSAATSPETSLTPVPAFTGAVIDKVVLERDNPVPPDPPAPVPDDADPPEVDFTALGRALHEAFSGSITAPPSVDPPAPRPERQPLPPPPVVKEQPLYRFDGYQAQFGFVKDSLASLRENDAEASARIAKFFAETFAVSTGDVNELNVPPNRPDMFVGPLRWQSRPLGNAISTAGITDSTPFLFPKWASSTPGVGSHTEGVEPNADGAYTATSQTVTPTAISGKAALTREVIDAGGNPAVDALVWAEMTNAYTETLEARVAAMLDAVPSTLDVDIVGVDTDAVDAVDDAIIELVYEKGGQRFNSFVLASDLYKALSSARDETGRALVASYGTAVNADGSRDVGFASLNIGGFRAVPAYGLGENDSFMLVRPSVWQWNSPPKKLTMDFQVANVYLGLFGYEAHAITRVADVRRWTYDSTP
jgi:hypothetical protein